MLKEEIRVFHNSYELASFIEKNKKELCDNSCYRDNQGQEFFNYKTCDDLIQEIKYGCKEYNNTYIEELKDLDVGFDTNNQYYKTDDGLFYDIGEVVNGSPECMLKDTEEGKKCLKVFIDVGFSWDTDNKVLQNRGISIFKLLYTLYMKNYLRDINWICFTEIAGRYEKMFFKLPENELNIPTIAAYCSPEFFRLMIVGMMHYFWYSQSGRSVCRCTDELKKEGLYLPGGYVDYTATNLRSIEESDKWVKKHFDQYVKSLEKGE